MTVLITGGAGFIGSKIANVLKDTCRVIVLDNFLEQVHGKSHNKDKDITYVNGDVRNISDWKQALKYNPSVIFHMASETGTGQSMDEIDRYVSTNINGTSIMLDLLNSGEYDVKKVILTSSRAVYGDSSNIETNLSLNPMSVYGVTKLTQELLLTTACKVPYTILRYQNVFGPGQSLNNPYTGIISIFSQSLSSNNDIEIYDSGIPTRDFIYVDDVVRATIICMYNNISDYKIYNVGTGVSTTILSAARQLKDILKSSSNIHITDYHRNGDIIHAVADIDKIKTEVNWSPHYSLSDGLSLFVEWFKRMKV